MKQSSSLMDYLRSALDMAELEPNSRKSLQPENNWAKLRRSRLTFAFMVSVSVSACGDRGASEPIPEAVHETQIASAAGEVRFSSGSVLRLRDATTGLPTSAITVTEIPTQPDKAYLLMDLSGKYRSETIQAGVKSQLSTRTVLQVGAGGALDGDIAMVPLGAFGTVTQGLTQMSDRAWEYVLAKFYTHKRMTFDELAAYLIEQQLEDVAEDVSSHVVFAALKFNFAGAVIYEVTDFVQSLVANFVNWYLMAYYQGLGYKGTDLFEVSAPTPAGSLFLNTQIILRPVSQPSGTPLGTGRLSVRLLNSTGEVEVSGATVEVVGPSSQRTAYRQGGLILNGLLTGDYVVQATAPNYRPGQVSASVQTGQETSITLRLNLAAGPIALVASGGTFNFPASNISATAFLVVMRAGIDRDAVLRITGPPGWNAGRVHVQALPSARQGAWFTDWLYFVPPVSGLYTAEVTAGGSSGQSRFSIDTNRRMTAPGSVSGQALSQDVVSAVWSSAEGAAGYRVAVADADRCDERNLCPTMKSAHVSSATRSITLEGVGLRPGQRFFIGVFSLRTPLFLSPPPIPDFFDLGYRASQTYVAPSSSVSEDLNVRDRRSEKSGQATATRTEWVPGPERMP